MKTISIWGYQYQTKLTYNIRETMKFYNLTPEPPLDRHRWFFSEAEARTFLQYNA